MSEYSPTIDEIRRLKKDAELEIERILSAFEQRTGTIVTGVEYNANCAYAGGHKLQKLCADVRISASLGEVE